MVEALSAWAGPARALFITSLLLGYALSHWQDLVQVLSLHVATIQSYKSFGHMTLIRGVVHTPSRSTYRTHCIPHLLSTRYYWQLPYVVSLCPHSTYTADSTGWPGGVKIPVNIFRLKNLGEPTRFSTGSYGLPPPPFPFGCRPRRRRGLNQRDLQ